MNHQTNTTSGWEPICGEPGEIVTASVGNPRENPLCGGKRRPVVLVRREGCNWRVMGLTSKASYADGNPRTPIPNPAKVGLTRGSYLWGQKLTGVCVLDLHQHIGWVDQDLADTVISQARLDSMDARALNLASGKPTDPA